MFDAACIYQYLTIEGNHHHIQKETVLGFFQHLLDTLIIYQLFWHLHLLLPWLHWLSMAVSLLICIIQIDFDKERLLFLVLYRQRQRKPLVSYQSVCLSVCPIFSFLDFSLQRVEILRWNFIHSLVLDSYRARLSLVMVDLFLKESCPLVTNKVTADRGPCIACNTHRMLVIQV